MLVHSAPPRVAPSIALRPGHHACISYQTRKRNTSAAATKTTSAESATSTGSSRISAVDFLAVAGISVPESAVTRLPELSVKGGVSIEHKVKPMLHFLQQQSLSAEDIELMLLRCPKLVTYNVECRSAAVVEFLTTLGFTQQQVAATIKRFPAILGFDTKGHLIPHCHYLKSLGLSDEELHKLILLRPHVLGSSIELVITYLRKWLRIERTHVGRLLWSYPIDYSVPRLILPAQDSLQSTTDSIDESSTNAGTDQQHQQQPLKPPIGSAERCTWFDLKSGNSSEDDGSNQSGTSST